MEQCCRLPAWIAALAGAAGQVSGTNPRLLFSGDLRACSGQGQVWGQEEPLPERTPNGSFGLGGDTYRVTATLDEH
jgi:hypothetical protein